MKTVIVEYKNTSKRGFTTSGFVKYHLHDCIILTELEGIHLFTNDITINSKVGSGKVGDYYGFEKVFDADNKILYLILGVKNNIC